MRLLDRVRAVCLILGAFCIINGAIIHQLPGLIVVGVFLVCFRADIPKRDKRMLSGPMQAQLLWAEDCEDELQSELRAVHAEFMDRPMSKESVDLLESESALAFERYYAALAGDPIVKRAESCEHHGAEMYQELGDDAFYCVYCGGAAPAPSHQREVGFGTTEGWM